MEEERRRFEEAVEAAADLVPMLVALGVTEPSMIAPSIPRARKALSGTQKRTGSPLRQDWSVCLTEANSSQLCKTGRIFGRPGMRPVITCAKGS